MEKHINNFYKKCSERKDCNRTKGLNRYYENKDKTSNQQKYIVKREENKNYYRKRTIDVCKLETLLDPMLN